MRSGCWPPSSARRWAIAAPCGSTSAAANEQGVWEPITPDRGALSREWEPHARGAILVAAQFRAFTNIYEKRVADLRRIATGGTGILTAGALHPDLIQRMADEASRAAQHMLTMSIRAIDYVPPVDLTFGEYLRALITADYDLVRDDVRDYRVAVVSAFRDWGIYPSDVRSLSVNSLLWNPPELTVFQHANDFFARHRLGSTAVLSDRLASFLQMREYRARFHDWLQENLLEGTDRFLGLALDSDAPGSIRRDKLGRSIFEVHSFRPCRRIGPDGQQRNDVIVEVVQRRKGFYDEDRQKKLDLQKDGSGYEDAMPDFYFRGGCTLIIDPETGDVRYCIRKSVCDDARLDRERHYRRGDLVNQVGGAYLSDDHVANPFALLHGGH